MPDQRSGPESLEWGHGLQDPRLPENSQPKGISNGENSHKGNHLNTRPGITQPPVEPCEGRLSKQQTGQKCKPNHQQIGLPPHSALPIRGKNKRTQHKSHPVQNLHKPLDFRSAEPK